MLQHLPHRHLAVQNGCVAADDLDIHISHRHEVPDTAASGILHSPAPLAGKKLPPFRGIAVAVPAGHGKPHIAAPFPVDPHRVVDLHQNIRHKRQSPQQRHAVGVLGFRMQRSEQQQLLIRQRCHPPPLIRPENLKIQRAFSLSQLDPVHPSAQQCRQIPVSRRRHHLAYGAAADQQRFQVLLQKGVDTVLSPPRRDPLQKVPQPLFCLRILTEHQRAAAEADQLAHGGVHHRYSLPHRLIQPQLSAALRRKAPQPRIGMPLPVPQLHSLGRCRFIASPFPKIQTNLSSLRKSVSYSPVHTRFWCTVPYNILYIS